MEAMVRGSSSVLTCGSIGGAAAAIEVPEASSD